MTFFYGLKPAVILFESNSCEEPSTTELHCPVFCVSVLSDMLSSLFGGRVCNPLSRSRASLSFSSSTIAFACASSISFLAVACSWRLVFFVKFPVNRRTRKPIAPRRLRYMTRDFFLFIIIFFRNALYPSVRRLNYARNLTNLEVQR